ncbi:MAG TPA: LytR C-terminal domain-containing protein [Candidatus Woesebacteria bacterium]|nr:LytR C-terminal domain-containing protein [Candidatus Woesebacteria bacterium]HPJ16800.1 LytR C-terminal domain-containing protein [Candidatus Woesebacteria bacterium]
MGLFSTPKTVLHAKNGGTDIYLDKKENNVFSFGINLWSRCPDSDINSLNACFKENNISVLTIIIPDDVVITKSFIYDSQITTIEKSEVISLAESFIQFKIQPDLLDYNLIAGDNKTIIQSRIYDPNKIATLKYNLERLSLKSFSFEPASKLIASVMSRFNQKEFFLLYPLSLSEYSLILCKQDSVYLTSTLKSNQLEVQKIINYSNLYFANPTTKFYYPHDRDLEIVTNQELEKTPYNSAQIASQFKKSTNLPLPVLGSFLKDAPQTVIINSSTDNSSIKKPMENKKNLLPLIAVFVVATTLASIAIWYVLNKNSSPETESPITQQPTPTITETTPTATPTPSVVVEVDKKIKIQVLNATDINGQAGSLKTKFVKLGFSNVTTGNTSTKATENTINLKASLATSSSYFQSQFADFTVSADLKENSSYDAVVTIGTDLSKSAKTTPTE